MMKKATRQKHKRTRLEMREKVKLSLDAWNKRLSTQTIEFIQLERPIRKYAVEYIADAHMLPDISYVRDYMANKLAHKLVKDKIFSITYYQDTYNPNKVRYEANIEIIAPRME